MEKIAKYEMESFFIQRNLFEDGKEEFSIWKESVKGLECINLN